jgi:hypothetical protein
MESLVGFLSMHCDHERCSRRREEADSHARSFSASLRRRLQAQFLDSFNLQDWTRVAAMNRPSEFVLVPRPSSLHSIFWRRDGFEDEDEHESTWLKNGSWIGSFHFSHAHVRESRSKF